MNATIRRLGVPVLLCGLALGCSSSPNDGPDDAIRQFYLHLNDGDYAGAMALYNAEAAEALDDPESVSAADFAEWARKETKEGRVDRVKVIREESDEGTATVEFELIYEDGTSNLRKVSLTQEDGQWRLGMIG